MAALSHDRHSITLCLACGWKLLMLRGLVNQSRVNVSALVLIGLGLGLVAWAAWWTGRDEMAHPPLRRGRGGVWHVWERCLLRGRLDQRHIRGAEPALPELCSAAAWVAVILGADSAFAGALRASPIGGRRAPSSRRSGSWPRSPTPPSGVGQALRCVGPACARGAVDDRRGVGYHAWRIASSPFMVSVLTLPVSSLGN